MGLPYFNHLRFTTMLNMASSLRFWVYFQIVLVILFSGSCNCKEKSAIGDPGMKRDDLRVAIEAWNQCNEVHEEAPNMGSPRQADCFDVEKSKSKSKPFFIPSLLTSVEIIIIDLINKIR